MTSRLTIAGAALLAAVALSAMAATTASAQNKTDHITATEEWTPTVSNVPGQKQVFRSTTGNATPRFECEEVSATVTNNISATVDTAALTPTYGKCIAINSGGTEASMFIDNGGCEYVIQSKTTTGNPTGGEHATVITRKHRTKKEEEEGASTACEFKITATALKFKCAGVPNQEVPDAIRYEQGSGEGSEKDTVINATGHGITNTTENSTACPTEKGGATEVHTDGSYVGKMTVKGHNAELKAVPITSTQAATP